MHAAFVLGALATATGAFAQNLPRMALAEPTVVAAMGVAARGIRECSSVVTDVTSRITTDAPALPTAVTDWLLTAPVTITDPCEFPVVTGDVGSALSSYESQYSAWFTRHLGDFRSLWSACSDVPGVTELVFPTSGACSSLIAQVTAEGATTSTPNAGPRETGMVAAAALAAGFVVAAGY